MSEPTKEKISKGWKFLQRIHNLFSDVIANWYAMKVPEHQLERCDGRVWYLPQHGVFHPRKKTLWVVFDCGAVFKGVSLNSQLLQGPNLSSTLLGALTRLRQEPIAIMADIQAMFHQVRVADDHLAFLRLLWWPGGDLSQEQVCYHMTVHIFGAVLLISCVCYALIKIVEDNQYNFSTEVTDTVKRNFIWMTSWKVCPKRMLLFLW